MRLKYTPRTASNEQVVARDEVDTPSPTGKNADIKRNITATNLPAPLRIYSTLSEVASLQSGNRVLLNVLVRCISHFLYSYGSN